VRAKVIGVIEVIEVIKVINFDPNLINLVRNAS
jgi:hypothetical protein